MEISRGFQAPEMETSIEAFAKVQNSVIPAGFWPESSL
jgi:hypothetical protein